MPDLVKRIARAKKELRALKAGFSGNVERFSGSTSTIETFDVHPTKAMLITVDFEYDDFPQLYTEVTDLNTMAVQVGIGSRVSLYQWLIPWQTFPAHLQVDCFLLSEYPPILFTLTEVS